MKRANTMSTITVELTIKVKTKFTSSNAEKTNEKTNGFISPQMSNFHIFQQFEKRMKAFDPQWIAFRNFVKTGIQFCSLDKNPSFFFRPTPSWLSPGRYTRSIAVKR